MRVDRDLPCGRCARAGNVAVNAGKPFGPRAFVPHRTDPAEHRFAQIDAGGDVGANRGNHFAPDRVSRHRRGVGAWQADPAPDQSVAKPRVHFSAWQGKEQLPKRVNSDGQPLSINTMSRGCIMVDVSFWLITVRPSSRGIRKSHSDASMRMHCLVRTTCCTFWPIGAISVPARVSCRIWPRIWRWPSVGQTLKLPLARGKPAAI